MQAQPAASKPILSNRYQLLQAIGTGGMAVVYRARDMLLERPVAIKVLRENYSRSEDFRERFKQEAQAAANLSHPNIVTVHDFGLDQGRLFLVMEYIAGTDLKAIIKQRIRLDVADAVGLMVQASAGIGYAHRAGIVHCDVKPHNMLVTPDQRLKVTDFGISRALASIKPDEQHDVIWGSPLYFSPEQAAGLPPLPASDVYSLGLVLYEMLTGQLPFQSDDPVELARMHREVPPPHPRRLNPDIPPMLEQILLKVLAKEPAARYRTADQFGRVLQTFSAQSERLDNPVPAAIAPARPVAPLPQPTPLPVEAAVDAPQSAPAAPVAQSEGAPTRIDWLAVFLGLLAVLAVGGLVPFWLYIWFSFNPLP
ncbi:MAG TPA: protein kinase [Anaerolineaceae bacterium]|nr:protein kinase [Anaerolineaceae bacterium]